MCRSRTINRPATQRDDPLANMCSVGETAGSRLRGHVIVCGLKGVGLRTVEQLHLAGVPVVVVDDDPDLSLARVVQDWGVPHVSRSAHRGDGLLEAGLERADAVVCAKADELETLETALRVREHRPDIRIAVQLANPLVGRALERVSGPGTVLDSAALAAPSFVEACVRRPAHNLDLGGTRFAVVPMDVDGTDPASTTFRDRFGSLVPVAIIPEDGGEIAVCPGRDHPVAPGDRVAVLGTVEELEEGGIDSHTATGEIPRSVGMGTRISRRAGALIRASRNSLMLVVAGLVGLILVSALILRFTYQGANGHTHLSLLESLYFTVETVATVGFGDFSFARQGSGIQIFGIALIVVGVSLVSTAFALFTNILVSRRIEQSLGRGQVPGMAGHVVVIGLGSIGINVVEGLVAEGRHVVVVERDDRNRYLSRARALKVPVIVADATQPQTHMMANLGEAAAVAVLTSSDLTNIETGLAVRESLGDRWGDVPVVLRVFDRNLARMMERNFGFRHVRSTSELAAPWFVGAALGLDVLGTFYVDQQPFLVGRVSITSGGGLEGLAMQDLSARTRVIALSRAADDCKLEHPPRRGTRFAGGDQAYVLGPYEELLRVLRRDQVPRGRQA
ncbi:MAG TPA: NAD-binding protein [Acidimicrobiales bacterium]|nr:NAD-binding protein [Acidimicrobiales bacterium]